MALTHSNNISDTSESKFTEFIQRGDDFLKIELLRQARNWYSKALELDSKSETARQKVAECDKLLELEGKVVRILIVTALVLFVVYILVIR